MGLGDASSDGARVTDFALWWEGIRCALINFPYNRTRYAWRQSARLLLCPVDLWRYHEFRAVVRAFRGEADVLDIGSPKLLALYLARRYGVPVVSTDIVKTVHDECVLYERAAWQGAIEPKQCDARALPFEDASFSFVYSVSVLEHIADDGDTRAIQEIARVLNPGGRAVITVPLVPEYRERWVDADPYGEQQRDAEGKVFFSRYYDWPALHERVIAPCGLRVRDARVWQERVPGWYERYCARTAHAASPLSILVKLLDSLWSSQQILRVETRPPQLTGHGLVALTFERG